MTSVPFDTRWQKPSRERPRGPEFPTSSFPSSPSFWQKIAPIEGTNEGESYPNSPGCQRRTPLDGADAGRYSYDSRWRSNAQEAPVFESLGERIQGVFKELRGEGHLTDFHLDSALRQIRLSLLEADVALPVVREFTSRVKEKAVGAKVLQQLSPAQEVTRIV